MTLRSSTVNKIFPLIIIRRMLSEFLNKFLSRNKVEQTSIGLKHNEWLKKDFIDLFKGNRYS